MARRWFAGTVFIAVSTLGMAALVHDTALSQQLQFHSKPGSTKNGKHHRVKTDLARTIATWRGTSDCRSSERARSAIKPVAAAWLGKQIVAHPKEKLVQWGYHSGNIWAESRVSDGKTLWIAGFRKLIVYADFKP